MKASRIIVLFLIFLLFEGCSRTNQLANFNVKGSKILIKEHVAHEARTIQFEEHTSQRNDQNKDDNVSEVIEAIADISTGILTSESKKKLQDAVDTESMVSYISGSLAETFETYLDMTFAESMNEGPGFIADITLNSCKLIVSSSSMSVYAKATAEVYDRNTGTLVWENSESKSIPLEDKTGNVISERSVEKFLNALKLNTLKPEELNEVLGNAVSEIGYDMGRTLRNDIAESYRESKK
jgi:hypothetical protein